MTREPILPPQVWYKTREKLPPQGLKVLYFDRGDMWVAYRFGQYWVPIPFCDSKFANTDPPDMWAYISLPTGYTGRMSAQMDGERISIDDMQIKYPTEYEDMVKSILDSIGNGEFWRDCHGK